MLRCHIVTETLSTGSVALLCTEAEPQT